MARPLMARLPDWLPGRVLYQLHSLGAAGAAAANPDVDAEGPCDRGFQRLGAWLDHVGRLGCGGVLLTPIAVSGTHGYDTVDPFRVDQRLGDEHDFAAFVDACHGLDLKLILDGVFNHVGRAFPHFRDVLQRGTASPYGDWFRIDFDRDDGDGFGYESFEGVRDLVALNHDNPDVVEWAASVARHWVDRGADGWRIDAAYAIPPGFISAVGASLGAHRVGTFVFGEMIHGDYARFVDRAGLDSVTQYELHKAIWSSLNDANFFELAWALERHRTYVATFTPVTFAGNHDVTRIATMLHDPGHIAHAVVLLCTLPGVPCVYYGDELGWRGLKERRAGGDDAIRPPLPPVAGPLDAQQAHVLDLHRRLIDLRRDRPWITAAGLDIVDLANRHIAYTVEAEGGALLVALDVDSGAVAPPVGWRTIAGGESGWVICERA